MDGSRDDSACGLPFVLLRRVSSVCIARVGIVCNSRLGWIMENGKKTNGIGVAVCLDDVCWFLHFRCDID